MPSRPPHPPTQDPAQGLAEGPAQGPAQGPASGDVAGAASVLIAGLLDGPPVDVREVARTRVSVHYETPHPHVPVLCICTCEAVALPGSLVTSVLPNTPTVQAGAGALVSAGRRWTVHRWWRPGRPTGLPRPLRLPAVAVEPVRSAHSGQEGCAVPLPAPSYDGLTVGALLGAGPGLTPAGDDVLAGALVTARAVGDPRLDRWRAETRRLLTPERTTAVSRGMLAHALEGYATAPLTDHLRALCLGADDATLGRTRAALLAVGHSSGAATLAGVLHTLTTHQLEGAA